MDQMNMHREVAGSSRASYGKACLACVKSKAKCENFPSSQKCKRCLSLNKDCVPAPTKRKVGVSSRKPKARPQPASKSANLEQKLDGIIHLLQATKGRDESTSQNQAPPSNISSPTVNGESLLESETEAELQECLDRYRSKMVPIAPVMPIAAHETVRSLSEKRPFLWLVIRTVANKSIPRQVALDGEIRVILAKELVMDGMKSLDTLLGILTFLTWCHHWVVHKPIITLGTYMAMSLISDLALDKPVNSDERAIFNISTQGCPKPPWLQNRGQRTLEERRALLAMFLVSSVWSVFLQRPILPGWTPYHDDCLQVLEDSREFPSDQMFIYLVRIQLIKNRISGKDWLESMGSPLRQDFYVKSINSEIEQLRSSLPGELRVNSILYLHMLDIKLTLHEYNLLPPTTKPNLTDGQSNALYQEEMTSKFEGLSHLLEAVKSYMDAVLGDSPLIDINYPEISLSIFKQMAHATILLFRLTMLHIPGLEWNRKKVIDTIDFGEVVSELAKIWKAVPFHRSMARKILDTGDERENDPDHREVWEEKPGDVQGSFTHAGKVYEVLGSTWRKTILPRLLQEIELGDAASQGGDASVSSRPDQTSYEPPNHQHQSQPHPQYHPQTHSQVDFSPAGISEGLFNWDMTDDRWMTELLGQGQEWFQNF